MKAALFVGRVSIPDAGGYGNPPYKNFRSHFDLSTAVWLRQKKEERKLPAGKSVGSQAELLSIVDELPREMVTEIVDFAQFLRHKQRALSERIVA